MNQSFIHLADGTLLQGGKYRIVRFINSGGFGCTYEGVHSVMGSKIAIKEFFVKDFCERSSDTKTITITTRSRNELLAKLRKKFIEEATSLHSMHHPAIVRVSDVFEENGTAYYVMDFIDGKPLSDIIKERGKLSEKEAIGYIRQIADALNYVHLQNRLHLDVKPNNIMVRKDGSVVLIDFGASKHYSDDTGENTSTLLGVNTPGYAPIELMSKSFNKFSPAVDIYSLGATLYKMLTGITPPDAATLISDSGALAPLPADVSEPTRRAIKEAMHINIINRPQSIDAFLALLDRNRQGSIVSDEQTDLTSDANESTILTAEKQTNVSNEVSSEEVSRNDDSVPLYHDNENNVAVSESENISASESSKKKRTWLWVAIGCLLVVLLGFGAYFMFISNKQNLDGVPTAKIMGLNGPVKTVDEYSEFFVYTTIWEPDSIYVRYPPRLYDFNPVSDKIFNFDRMLSGDLYTNMNLFSTNCSYEFLEDGRLKEQNNKKTNKYPEVFSYEYDKDKRLKEIQQTVSDNKIVYRYNYSDNETIIYITQYDHENKVHQNYKIVCISDKNTVSYEDQQQDGMLWKIHKDDAGKIHKVDFQHSSCALTFSFNYDEKGNVSDITSQERINGTETVVIKTNFDYSDFDKYGNWTKRTAISTKTEDNEKSQYKMETTREITYY